MFVRVWQKMQEEYLRELNYNASVAKLYFSVNVSGHDNIEFEWSGFNHSMPNYIFETITRIK
jgi:hypothetical protein